MRGYGNGGSADLGICANPFGSEEIFLDRYFGGWLESRDSRESSIALASLRRVIVDGIRSHVKSLSSAELAPGDSLSKRRSGK